MLMPIEIQSRLGLIAAGIWLAVGMLLVWDLFLGLKISRRVLAELAVPFFLLDRGAHRLVGQFLPTEYVLEGSCHSCGVCCEQILGHPPGFVRRSQKAMLVFIAFHRLFHRFEAVARTQDGGVLFRCGHLQSDGRCGIYRLRPLFCRNYPVMPARGQTALPALCSYKIAARAVSKMQKRPSLRILNPHTAVHHPTPISDRCDEGPIDTIHHDPYPARQKLHRQDAS